MKYFLIDTDSVKAAEIVNYNVNDEDCGYAIRESQNTYLREILGDSLLEKCVELASGDTLDNEGNEAYKELVDHYIFDYLAAQAQVCLLVPISLKIRNIGQIIVIFQLMLKVRLEILLSIKGAYDSKISCAEPSTTNAAWPWRKPEV